MKIFVDVREAANRLEELIDLASRHDEAFVCRGGQPVSQLTALPVQSELPADDIPSDEERHDQSIMPFEGEKHSPIEEVSKLCGHGRPTLPKTPTSSHEEFGDEDGPR
jgi:antitoxin (DNA-binding transcriptional repressor) of toxin-antitoxin stability system